MTLRKHVHQWLEPGEQANPFERFIDSGLIALILLSVVATILETMPELSGYAGVFAGIEWVAVAIFSIEYVLRLWTCVELPPYAHPFWGRVRYVLSPMALVDLLAILPFYLPWFGVDNLVFLRILRLFRLLRLLKLYRYSQAMQTLAKVFRNKSPELLVCLSLLVVVLLVVSSLIYLFENAVQPKAFPSIPASLWWGIVTMTTVGYGDVYPLTAAGRLLGGLVAITGLLLFAIPTGILAAGFSEELERSRKEKEASEKGLCPHCGRPLEEHS